MGDLIVWHATFAMFGAYLEFVWRFEWRTLYIGSLRCSNEFGPQ
jgi:hypothetical protein